MAEPIKAGDFLWVEPHWSSKPLVKVKVEKVGRKWIYLTGGLRVDGTRQDAETFIDKDFNRTYYRSREAWEAKVTAARLRIRLRDELNSTRYDLAKLRQVAAILGVEDPTTTKKET